MEGIMLTPVIPINLVNSLYIRKVCARDWIGTISQKPSPVCNEWECDYPRHIDCWYSSQVMVPAATARRLSRSELVSNFRRNSIKASGTSGSGRS